MRSTRPSTCSSAICVLLPRKLISTYAAGQSQPSRSLSEVMTKRSVAASTSASSSTPVAERAICVAGTLNSSIKAWRTRSTVIASGLSFCWRSACNSMIGRSTSPVATRSASASRCSASNWAMASRNAIRQSGCTAMSTGSLIMSSLCRVDAEIDTSTFEG